jgi:hypothetical protein
MSDFHEYLANDDNFDAFDDTADEKDASGVASRQLIKGGLEKTDTTGMSSSRAAAVLRQYHTDRKRYTNSLEVRDYISLCRRLMLPLNTVATSLLYCICLRW